MTLAPAGEKLEAESYSEQSGIDTEECSEGGRDVAFIENGDYIGFKDINFGRGAESVNFRIGSNGAPASIEVRLGSPDGKLIGTMDVSSTGGWRNADLNNDGKSSILDFCLLKNLILG